MGFIARFRELRKPRHSGSGKVWDNVNNPNSKGASGSRIPGGTTTPAVTEAYIKGPNPEPYLQTMEWKSPYRLFTARDHLLPQIPVSEPWNVSSTYNSAVASSTSQYNGAVAATQPQSHLKAIAPSQTRQRDLIWDAANPMTIRADQAYTPSQRYFNQMEPLPEFTTPLVRSNAVIAGNNSYYPSSMQHGWIQTFVSPTGPDSMRQNEVGTASPWLLSAPLKSTTIIRSLDSTHRQPIKAKAPQRQRGGG